MAYRKAKSLDTLLAQINSAFPSRDKTSDGWIGDAAHASRKSDHNPWVKDGNMGVVTAIDIDEDLNSPVKLQNVIDAICISRDPRVKYIIYEGRITVKGSNLQAWKRYAGTNAHKHHAHISVNSDKKSYDDPRPWAIENQIVAAAAFDSMPEQQFYMVARGDTLWGLARKFATSVAVLKDLNSLPSDVIQIGQKLRVK
jgi:LysM repeat protein